VTTAKLFANGRSRAVRLPREFRFAGREIRIRRFGLGVPLEPAEIDVDDWLAALDRFAEPFMADGREQPLPPAPTDCPQFHVSA
jgi:antitoxin VapB